jgi:hypothetical protein
MPLTDASNPQGMVGQQAPALGTDAPQGAGLMASPQAGLPPGQPGSPQATMMLGQIAAKLLQKQQGVKYAQDMSKNIRTILQKMLAAQMFENPQAESDLASIIQKLGSFGEKLGKSGPSQSPALTTSLADMVKSGGASGAMQ